MLEKKNLVKNQIYCYNNYRKNIFYLICKGEPKMKKIFKNIFFLLLVMFAFSTNVYADNSIICSGDLGNYIKQIFHIVKFAVPVLIIGLGIVDFVKAMTAQSQDEIKKASTKLIKRLIIGACIFVLPTIIDFLLKIAEVNTELCGW